MSKAAAADCRRLIDDTEVASATSDVRRGAGAMKQSYTISPPRAAWLCCIGLVMMIPLMAGPIAPACADDTSLTGVPSQNRVAAFAMRWFTEMQAGRTDRSLYAPPFAAQVTDEAVQR